MSAPRHAEALELLRERLGLRLVAGAGVEELVREVCKHKGCAPSEVPAVLAALPRAELRRFAERLLVHETFLFRHPRHFDLLSTEFAPQVIANRERSGGPPLLRLWSAGCATGEEAYALGIWARGFLATHHPGWQARVIGSDLSSRALAVAARARYGTWSLRGEARERGGAALVPVGDDEVEIAAEVRRDVTFTRVDLSDPEQVAAGGPQDIVLCRNVLMYLRPASAQAALDAIADVVSDGGVIVCEAHDLVGLKIPPALTLCERGHEFALCRGAERRRAIPVSVPRAPSGAAPRLTPTPPPTVSAGTQPPEGPAIEPAIAQAAAKLGDDPHLLRMAALVLDLDGDLPAAERLLRSAVAIDADFHQARLDLGMLLMRDGRAAEGRAIIRRLRTLLTAQLPSPAAADLISLSEQVLALGSD